VTKQFVSAAHVQEGSGLELDFVYALAQAKSVNITVALLVDGHEQVRFYYARSEKAMDPTRSYVFGFADGMYNPVGWRVVKEEDGEHDN
jgi:hypothetical protein